MRLLDCDVAERWAILEPTLLPIGLEASIRLCVPKPAQDPLIVGASVGNVLHLTSREFGAAFCARQPGLKILPIGLNISWPVGRRDVVQDIGDLSGSNAG